MLFLLSAFASVAAASATAPSAVRVLLDNFLYRVLNIPRPAPPHPVPSRRITKKPCCSSLKVHRALVILEPVETDVESLRALVSLDQAAGDGGSSSTRTGKYT